MNETWWRTLFREQQGSGFAGISGAEGSVVLPISDALLTSLVVAQLPSSVPVRTLELSAESADQFAVRVKLSAPAFLPPFNLRFAIVGQPRLPESPTVTFQMLGHGMGALVGLALRLLASLPPWVRVDQDRVHVNIALLAAQYGAADYFRFLTDLRVTTAPGRFVISARASLAQTR